MKKIIESPLFWVISIEIGIAIVLGVLGFKITYNPTLDNNWDAVSACAAWTGVFVSGMAFLATIAVLYQNHKTIELSKKDIQNSINLQMFDKMMNIANRIENDDYSSTKMELITLFGQDIWNQVDELRNLELQKINKESEKKRYEQLLKCEEDYDCNLEYNSQYEDAPDEIVKKAKRQHEEYRVLSESDGMGNTVDYNIDDINKELSELEFNISANRKYLKNSVFRILRNKFPLN